VRDIRYAQYLLYFTSIWKERFC